MKKSRMIRKIGSVLFLLMIVAVLSGENSYAKENNTYLELMQIQKTDIPIRELHFIWMV